MDVPIIGARKIQVVMIFELPPQANPMILPSQINISAQLAGTLKLMQINEIPTLVPQEKN